MPRSRRTNRRRTRRALAPITVRIPKACCTGWFFEHTSECPTPNTPRPCSECAAPAGTEHHPGCQWSWT